LKRDSISIVFQFPGARSEPVGGKWGIPYISELSLNKQVKETIPTMR
jgi:hypothetical protein